MVTPNPGIDPQRLIRSADWPLLVVLLALFATLIPSWNIGFICEDYCHLVEESARLPLISSYDGLHRPLRSALLKLAYRFVGLNSAPYHLGIILLHLAAVALLYRFVWRIGGNRLGALAAAVLYGFFPRNHQAVFWVSAGADSAVVICVFAACNAFFDYLEKGRIDRYLIALFALVLGLGFKETAVSIGPLLLLVHLTCTKARRFSFRRYLVPYLPFAIVEGLFVLWVAGYVGHSDIAQNFYGFQGVSQTIKMAVKFILNMALPFSGTVEARELLRNFPAFVVALMVMTGSLVAGLIFLDWRKLFFVAGWVLISMAPTVALGFYNDRYLSLPFVGLAILGGFIVAALVTQAQNQGIARVAVLLGLSAYGIASIVRLTHYERGWRAAAAEVRAVMDETRRLFPRLPDGSILTFVNLSHDREDGQIYIFNMGLNGALWAWGYDTSVTYQRTFSASDPREEQLVQRLLDCRKKSPPSQSGPYVLLVKDRVLDVSGECASRIVELSRKEEVDLWPP